MRDETKRRGWFLLISIFNVLILSPLEEGEVYLADLADLEVQDSSGRSVGRVLETYENGAQIILEVSWGQEKKDIPFVEAFVLGYDLDEGWIQLISPRGYLVKTIWVVTLFPQYFSPLVERGVVGKAFQGKFLSLRTFLLRGANPTDFKGVDEAPYGGGQGMVIRPDVLLKALEDICHESQRPLTHFHVILPSPRGEVWDQQGALEFSRKLTDSFPRDIIFICGRYEGIDERFIQKYVHQEISLGDYILSGGELATMVILDSSVRLCPGVLGHPASSQEESFVQGLLEHPQYTRPREFEGLTVPEVLLSGHSQKIVQWKQKQSCKQTEKYRPDLWRLKK